MRITGGMAKGHKLSGPKSAGVRPTADIVKEALFNILAPYIDETVFLDLFAGTGSVGLEAMSRGAREVYFVDNKRQCVQLIKSNVSLLRMSDKAKIILADAIAAVDLLSRKQVRFDIIFMDPPYEMGYISKVLKAIVSADILNRSGILVVQRSKREALGLADVGWSTYKERAYGDTILDFIRREDN
ncbi:16S rRNA (guanine(966)-N(2))-methyltransferase RsmD [Mahella australiensis]|uniref:Methyltransferase n=1 Tax=Mahella australiensis (strain DSM 15567 / CIP 107919 / 50-1 BON) TaxID=697281 RepID=F4A2L6_MAHA5|nr:16S rRNA (guanine(966)-N(2))-methyltransferase RsmD [Mahella australiensis]AEE96196.1 methyltransferase [Mahella australiensis 50-1 BON]